MASTDLEEFIYDRLRAYDPNVDLAPGSTVQQQVVQPLLRRLGTDPFTMNLEKFIGTRLMQEFPEISTDDGDAIMDLLVGPARVLLEPLVQEIKRVKENLSFKDPSTLTTTEAEALAANYFATRNSGDFARVTGRLYFASPQNAVVTPGNYLYTSTGLRFLPTSIQSISASQMLFNKEGSYYYMDVAAIAEEAGDAYNIEVGALRGVQGIPAVVRVTNKLRAFDGEAEESVEEFISRVEQDIAERSLVTQRGILAVLGKTFTAIERFAVVGFNDPNMKRDVLRGMGIGAVVVGGKEGYAVPSGSSGASRWFRVDDAFVDFTALIGPAGYPVQGYTLTVAGDALVAGSYADLVITHVVDARTVAVQDAVFKAWYSGSPIAYWMLRRNELTLAGVAGGTALPGPVDEVVVSPDVVHVGGMVDVYVQAGMTDQGSLDLTAVTDGQPLLLGTKAVRYPVSGACTGFRLDDFVLGTTYETTSVIFSAFDTAKDKGLVLQVMDGDAGSYRILGVAQVQGSGVVITTDPAPAGYPLTQRWRLLDTIDIDLAAPMEVKLFGSGLVTVQGSTTAHFPEVQDLAGYGIEIGDYLDVLSGGDVGVFQITALPSGGSVTVDAPFTRSSGGVSYRVFRKLSKSVLNLPLVRIRKVDVLDSGGEPIGVSVPLADPVDVRAFDFTTPTNALYLDLRDAVVGCVGKPVSNPPIVNGLRLSLNSSLWNGYRQVTFSGVVTMRDVADQINAQVGEYVAGVVNGDRLGISPLRAQYKLDVVATYGNDALSHLFDTSWGVTTFSTNQIRSSTVIQSYGGWGTISYDGDFDAVHVVDVHGETFAYEPLAVAGGTALQVSKNLFPSVGATVRVGPRAVGRARCYFLDPTTFEVGATTVFEATDAAGGTVRFVPDPTINALRYPPPPSGGRAKDGVTSNVGYGKLSSNEVDFIRKGIVPGDVVVVDYVPITADYATSETNVVGAAMTTFVVRVNGVERTVVFGNDVESDATAVSKAGIVKQLNSVLGAGAASFTDAGFLELEVSYDLRVVGGTSLGYFWSTFTATYPAGVDNLSANYDGGKEHTIFEVQKNYVMVTGLFVSGSRQQFKVSRPGTQRIGTTQMALNTTHAGMYYADVQVVSEGTGPLYNIAASTEMRVRGHVSLGYRVTNEHPHLAFSVLEKPTLRTTPTIISSGAADDPQNALQLAGQNFQVSYDWSSLAAAVQGFVSAESERVVTASMLARHLPPYYVRLDMTYSGGAQEDVVAKAVAAYIRSLSADELLEVVKVQNVPLALGAATVSTPVHVVAVVHGEDRAVRVEQSVSYLNKGRLAGFFVEGVNIKRAPSL